MVKPDLCQNLPKGDELPNSNDIPVDNEDQNLIPEGFLSLGVELRKGGGVGYIFKCPGCVENQALYVRSHTAPNGESWILTQTWRSQASTPACSPEFSTRTNGRFRLCHLYVNDGKSQFLRDCTYSLADQLVEILEQN